MTFILSILGCDTPVPEHICNTCETPEGARIRGLALIKKTFSFADPTNPTEWTAAIASGDAIIIPETSGSLDSSPKYGKGYGDLKQKLIGDEYTLKVFDPNYKQNCAFWNAIKYNRNFKGAYVTETQVHMIEEALSIAPKAPVADDVDGEVVWEIDFTWSSKYHPCAYDKPDGIFNCFIAE